MICCCTTEGFVLSQETGIGRAVNNVRKLEGKAGELAKELVTKWKDMVSEAEKAEKAKPPVPLFSEFLNQPTCLCLLI